MGLLDLVEPEMRIARENSANASGEFIMLAVAALMNGRYQDALRIWKESGQPLSGWYAAHALFHTGDTERSLALLSGTHDPSIDGMRRDAARAGILAALGRRAEAQHVLTPLLAGNYRDHHLAQLVGVAHAQLGNPTEATRWLRRAADWGFRCYPWYATDGLLKPLRQDAGFRRLLEELRISWENDKARYGSRAVVSATP
jgi:hypothetical protein